MAAKKVKATFDYLATEPGELSIKKGDIIIVLEVGRQTFLSVCLFVCFFTMFFFFLFFPFVGRLHGLVEGRSQRVGGIFPIKLLGAI